MKRKSDRFDYLVEIPSGKWIVREEPGGRAVGCIELVGEGDRRRYEVTTWHENPAHARHIGYANFLLDACRLAWKEGRRRTPPVAQTKWTPEMIDKGPIKHG